jgi:rod shape-determining protein MreD
MSIMPRGEALLLPASPLFIAFTLLLALCINMLPWDPSAARPDVLVVVLAFWVMHQPRRIGVGIAFLFGLAMDVHQGALLGQHSLAYTLMAFGAAVLHRRLLWFPLLPQTAQVVPLFALSHLVQVIVRLAAGDGFSGWGVLLAPLFEGLLWPLASILLLAPQRRAPDPDQNRPL